MYVVDEWNVQILHAARIQGENATDIHTFECVLVRGHDSSVKTRQLLENFTF